MKAGRGTWRVVRVLAAGLCLAMGATPCIAGASEVPDFRGYIKSYLFQQAAVVAVLDFQQ